MQVDALVPTLVPQFSGSNPLTRCAKIAAGPANTLFIDQQGMVLLCGKWKVSGDGSSGQVSLSLGFGRAGERSGKDEGRLTTSLGHGRAHTALDESQARAGYHGLQVAAHQCRWVDLVCPHSRGEGWQLYRGVGAKLRVWRVGAWGRGGAFRIPRVQLVRTEMADFNPCLTTRQAKSATKPKRNEMLEGIDLLDIAAGQNTTFFVARPPPLSLEAEPSKGPSPVESPAPVAAAAAPTAEGGAGGVDLSGFGFSFGAASASASAAPAAAPALVTAEHKVKSTRSRTIQEQWEENVGRFPPVYDALDYCAFCGKEEGPEEALECEMVSLTLCSVSVRGS